jgi:hypothetical protein
MFLKDPKTGEKSVTVTLLVIGFSVALIKLLLADSEIGSFKMGPFGSSDFGIIIGSLGALYSARKYTDKDKGDK